MDTNRRSFLKGLFGTAVAATLPNIITSNQSYNINGNNSKTISFKTDLRDLRLELYSSTNILYQSILNKKLISPDVAFGIRKSINNLNNFAIQNKNNKSIEHEINHIGWDWQRINALTYANSYILECEPLKAISIIEDISNFNMKFPFSFSESYPNSLIPANSFMRNNWDSLGRTFIQFGEYDLAKKCLVKSLDYGKNPIKNLVKKLNNGEKIDIDYVNVDYDKWTLTQRFI